MSYDAISYYVANVEYEIRCIKAIDKVLYAGFLKEIESPPPLRSPMSSVLLVG